jgi:hypothetical protein
MECHPGDRIIREINIEDLWFCNPEERCKHQCAIAINRSANIIVRFLFHRSTNTPVKSPRTICGRREAMVA